jgi:phosphoribosylformylglycinamidine cyclo-ligase
VLDKDDRDQVGGPDEATGEESRAPTETSASPEASSASPETPSCGCGGAGERGTSDGERSSAYAEAGVDIEAGEEAVRLIEPLVAETRIPGVLSGLGGFAALYEMPGGMEKPVLVAATDGVGTKLLVAREAGKLNTIGIDLVAMCANDVLCHGASPILFLDYLAVAKLVPEEVAQIVEGIARGCKEAGCALVGGEMAEMPGLYAPGHFDLAGFCVGLAEKDHLVDGSQVEAGDVVIGLASSGLHSNGYSLVRRILEENQCCLDDKFPHFGENIAYTLLQPTRIYADGVWAVLEKGVPVHAMAHVTGGGIGGNLGRVIPDGFTADLHFDNWKVPKVFKAIQHLGELDDAEMFRTFNMGVGFVLIVPYRSAEYAASLLLKAGEQPMYLGSVIQGERKVRLEGVL